ncbi:hypothetical protein K7G98_00745 [Saccharothrix sp. MB29]|nr:hypothetical protein [Saccharothrix sp. MB29]
MAATIRDHLEESSRGGLPSTRNDLIDAVVDGDPTARVVRDPDRDYANLAEVLRAVDQPTASGRRGSAGAHQHRSL